MTEKQPNGSSPSQFRIGVMLATFLPFADGVLDYWASTPLAEGVIVIAPLGARKVMGVVVRESQSNVAESKLKPLIGVTDCPPITSTQMTWIKNVAAWTMTPPGLVLKMMLPTQKLLEPVKKAQGWVSACAPDAASSDKRRLVLEAALHSPPRLKSELARLCSVSPNLVNTMITEGLLVPAAIEDTAISPLNPDHEGLTLNAEQQVAATSLKEAIMLSDYAPFLLDGVTGSGKTEVYLEAVAATIKAGRQTLILLPEISLSDMVMSRFEARFGGRPFAWHSGLGARQRHETFCAAQKGEATVVVGARSALFLPYHNLGLIVVDEEHDTSYKQDEQQVIYNARDMAVMRAAVEKTPIVLVSATPSLESEVNAEEGRYRHLKLSKRAGDAQMPEINLINIAQNPPERGYWLAEPLVEEITKTLADKRQVLLFLNRRGYAPVMVCHRCGEKLACPNCSAWLVMHKSIGLLQCHHCGHAKKYTDSCPACQTEGEMAAYGPGVERLAEEVALRWPQARQAVLSSDTTANPAEVASLMADIRRGVADEHRGIDIIIGTQVIAKGHHFPELALVGVVDADFGLVSGDLRAAEHTWHMLTQVSGRAGRMKQQGKAMLQTASPETPLLRYLVAGDRQAFIATEKAARSESGMPPYGRLASITLSSPSMPQLRSISAVLERQAPRYQGVLILGPAPAPIAVLRGRHRLRFIVRAEKKVNLQAVIREWLGAVKLPNIVRLQIDIDPYHFV